MATGRIRILTTCLALATGPTLVGCAQSGPLGSRQTTMGSLKAGVSQLEFDNEGLRKQLADLKAENRRIENKLVQEQEANGEVTAQLDDARDLIRRQGGDTSALGSPTKSASYDDDGIPPPVSSPSRRSRSSRKPPAASIPRAESSSWPDPETDSTPRAREVGPQSRLEDDDRWLPVARGKATPVRF